MATEQRFPLSIILRTVDHATAGLRNVGNQVDRIGKKVGAFGKKMTTHLTLPIAAGFAFAVHSLAEFEKGMASVSTLIDTNTEDIGRMGAAVLEIGRRTPVALDDLTGALYQIRSAGVAAGDQMRVLEQSARLGVAGLGSTKESVDLVTSSINAFQLKGEDAARVFDTIFTTVKSGKTTIAELGQGFGAVAGTMAASNVKFDEYLASVAALTITGLPAAQAHTQLRAVIAGLTRTTDKTSKVFRKLGAKDFKDLIAKSGGLVPALDKIRGLLKGNSSRMLELVGSTEALNAMIGLTGAQGATFASTLADMRDGADSVSGAFDKQNKTMTAGLQRTKNAMASVAISVGTILAPSLEKLAGWLQRVADWFDKLSPATKEWTVGIAAAVAALGLVVAAVGFILTPVGLVVIAIAAVSAAVVALVAHWDDVTNAIHRALIALGLMDAVELGSSVSGALNGAPARTVRGAIQGTLADPRRLMGVTPPDSFGGKTETRVKVDFANAPLGTRVTADPRSTSDVDLSVGFQMGWSMP